MNRAAVLLHLFLPVSMSALLACGDARDVDSRPGNGDQAPADDASSGAATDTADAAGAPKTVTLLTGDRVLVHADGGYTIDPGPGRRGIGFRGHVIRGHQYVVPADAARLIAAGALDPRLFDVTQLLELEYDDAHRADLPVIVTDRAADRTRRRTGMARSGTALVTGGARLVRQLPSLRGAAMRVPKRGAGAAWSALAAQARSAHAGGGTVWLDGKRKLVLDRSAPQIGAPAAWEAGYTGLGVTIAVLDSGIDAAHPDFAGRIVEARSFIEGDPDPADDFGHGTHVASIAAGSGAADGGVHRGIAPDAELLIGRVCRLGSCPDSAILEGLEWAAASGATVVNLSLGGADTPDVDPIEQAINALTAEHGMLVVASAGNEGNCGGPDELQVGSPSTADAALSVGAVDVEDEVAEFSCRGPRIGDGAIKPDITAPGVGIAAARAVGTEVGDEDPVDDFYARVSGTSMAAPHVTGAAALLAQQHPEWRAAELKAALMGSARPGPGAGVLDEGAGRVDLARAIDQSVFAAPASISLGLAPWPHDDDEPAVRTVTYHNSGTAPLTLQLAIEASGPAGAPPTGMFAVEPAALTIPPGGAAQATLTVDTRVSGPDGVYAGALIATAGEQVVRTPLAIDREVESYDLDITYLDRDGNPALGFTFLVDLDSEAVVDLGGAVGATSTRVPVGRYNLESLVVFEAAGQEVGAIFVQPVLEVSQPVAVSLDARTAQPVDVRVPRPTARRHLEVVSYDHRTADFRWSGQYTYFGTGDEEPGFVAIYTAHLGAPAPESEFVSGIVSQWSEPHAPGASQLFADSPYDYYLRFFPDPGRFPTGFVRHVEHRDLATVHAEYGAQASTSRASLFSNGLATGIQAPPSQGATSVIRLPMSRTEYYSTEHLTWATSMWETVDDQLETFRILLPPTAYQAGGRYRARWDAAVVGPGLRAPLGEPGIIVRTGDELRVSLESLYSDANGHAGGSFMATNEIRLHRDGALIGESDEFLVATFEMPGEPGRYRLEVESHGGRSRLSTDVQVAWTFDSEHAGGPDPALPPVMTVGFAPRLDEYGRAPAGRPIVIPFSIERQTGAPASPVSELTVEASHDRGETWQEVAVLRFGDCGVALVEHPDEAGTVSLRARAMAESGDTVEQTILDAYALR
jgi:subtilisin family serine protease